MSAALDAVFSHIDGRREANLARLLDYLRHPSISAENVGIREVAGLLVAMLEKMGGAVQVLETAGHPMIVTRWDGAPGKPTVLLYGHYDVQPPDPLELWTTPPFEPTIRDGRIYARGVADNKAQHLAQIMAIESHLAVHGGLPCNVVLMLEGEEEIGSPHMAAFVREHKNLLRADLAVTADGQLHPSGRPTMKFGSRGVVSIELRAHHAKRDVHSGNFGGVVPNPLWTLVHLLATMKNPAGEITVDGFYDGVTPPSEAERAIAAALPLDLDAFKAGLGLSRLDAPAERPYYDRLCFWPTLTINGLHGGYGGPGTKTVLPAEAVAKLDARLVAGQQPPDIIEKLRAHVAKHAPEVEFVCMEEGMWPSKTPTDSPWTVPLTEALRVAHGAEPLLYPAGFGSLPGYTFTDILGIPAFVTPYANADAANHAPDENMAVENFYRGIRTGAAVMSMVGNEGPR